MKIHFPPNLNEFKEAAAAFVEEFEIEESKERSLSLLRTDRGLQKWYLRKYGYPVDESKFAVVRFRSLAAAANKVSRSIERAGLADCRVWSCSPSQVELTRFADALDAYSLPYPQLVIDCRIRESKFALFITEEESYLFSRPLWALTKASKEEWREIVVSMPDS
jgi:hypothetical protein